MDYADAIDPLTRERLPAVVINDDDDPEEPDW